MARPCKLTPDVQAVIVGYIRMGNWPEVAAGAAGVCRKTFYNWMRRGRLARRKDSKYALFVKAVDAAVAAFEANAVMRLHGARDWRADRYRLERRVPERWGVNAGGETPEKARAGILALMDTLRSGQNGPEDENETDDPEDANGEASPVDR